MLGAVCAAAWWLVPGSAAAQGPGFDFDDTTVQGWTLDGAYDADAPEKRYPHDLTLVWADTIDYPSTSDPVGNGKGALAVSFPRTGAGIQVPGDAWLVRARSPDLSRVEAWQRSSGVTLRAITNISKSELQVVLSVEVLDHDAGELRRFDGGRARTLPAGEWQTLGFSWSEAKGFPEACTVVRVEVGIVGFVQGSYEGLVAIDAVAGTPLECGAPTGIQAIEAEAVVETTLTACWPARGFRVVEKLPMGRHLAIRLTDETPDHSNALYARWGAPASPERFDAAAAAPGSPGQEIVLDFLRMEPLYLCVAASRVPANGHRVKLQTELVDLAITGSSLERAGRDPGRVSGSVEGAGFDGSTRFRLVRAGTVHESVETVVRTGARADVAFDLEKAPAGVYDLEAVEGQARAVLPGAFEIGKSRNPPILTFALAGPSACRYGRDALLWLECTNRGDLEVAAPLVEVAAPAGTLLRTGRGSTPGRNAVQVLACDPSAVAGRLSPGARARVPIWFRSTSCFDCDLRFEARVLAPSTADAIAWASLPVPEGMSAAGWATARGRLDDLLGRTWIEYGEGLAERATRLARRGVPASSVVDLFRFAVREALGRPTGAAVGTIRDRDTGRPLAGATIVARLEGTIRSSAKSDRSGRFTLDWLKQGATYDLLAVDHDLGGATVSIPRSGDALGLEVAAAPAPNAVAPSCADCDDSGLPTSPIQPPKRLFAPVATLVVPLVSSWDPNEKDGPIGPGGDGVIGATDEIAYTVFFENESSASASAQRVVITDRLESDLDWSTFRMVGVQIGSRPEQTFYFETFSDGSGAGFEVSGDPFHGFSTIEVTQEVETSTTAMDVDFEYALDISTGELVFTFTSFPDDPLDGFLLPNDTLSQGEGHVSFAVTPIAGLSDGTEIENDAEIRFDALPAVTTNAWTNVIGSPQPPDAPAYPVPADTTAHAVDAGTSLSWGLTPGAETWDLRIWREGDAEPAAPTAEGLVVPGHEVEGGFLEGETYRWRVTARNSVGDTAGPAWAFRTAGGAETFLRGDTDSEGNVNITDGIFVLNFLFLGGPAPPCEDAADANDDQLVNITDGIYILNFLFLGGPAPPAPYPACGEDPTADELACAASPGCP